MLVRKIGFLLFENFTAMDVSGPLEAFSSVSEVCSSHYELITIGLKPGIVRAESGLGMVADVGLEDIPQLDTLIIPGGKGTRDASLQAIVNPWINQLAKRSRRIVSVCTGSFLLASSGLLDDQQATTHWAYADEFRSTYPKVRLVPDALFIDNGKVSTSAGIAAGIDLSLKLIEDDLGSEIAAKVARFMVVHFRRAGHQAQYSEPLQYQHKANEKFASLTGWVQENLASELSLEKMAQQSGMSVRNFCRKFTQQMGTSPGRYVETLRLDYARQLLVEKEWKMSRIGIACGYDSADVFRRAFERRFSLSPKAYRASFKQSV